MARSDPPAPRRGYHHGNLREALMNATVELVARDGVRGFSLHAAARLAGVSTAAPYRHFAGGEDLLTAVVERGWTRFRTALTGAAARHPGDPLARLAALGRCYVDFALGRPAEFRLLFAERTRAGDRAAGRAAFDVLLGCVTAAHRGGLLRPGRTPVDVAHAAWALVHGLAVLRLDGDLAATRGPGGEDAAVDTAVDLFVDGIRADHSP